MKRIFFVEDDLSLIGGLTYAMKKEGYEVENARTAAEAEVLWAEGKYDLVILDVALPDGTGFALCEKMRQISKVPIIFLTAADEETDMIMGLDIGADDYVVKPFSPSEVMARVRAVLRRMGRVLGTSDKKVLTIGDLTINIEAYTVFVGAEKVPMTKKEVETMWILAGNPSKVFTRDNLLDSLWGQDYFGDSRTVDSHIKRLRAKLDKVEHPDWEIKTIWGLGYKFEINV